MTGADESFDRLRSSAASWIGSADTKATALVAVGAALLTVVAGFLAATNGIQVLGRAGAVVFLGFCLTIALSVAAAAATLWPRTSRRKILEGSGWTLLERSPSYFADLADLPKTDFERLLGDEALRTADRVEQVFVLCRVATAKMHWLRVSVAAIIIGLACLLLLLVLIAFPALR